MEPLEKVRPSHLNVQFVKITSMAFEIQRQDDNNEKSIIAEQKRISRNFIPFVTTPSPGVTYSGVFFTGDRPNWILAGNKSGVQIFPSGHSVVHAFTACSLWESRGDFLLYTEEVSNHVEIFFSSFFTFFRVPVYCSGCRICSWMGRCPSDLFLENEHIPMFCLTHQQI